MPTTITGTSLTVGSIDLTTPLATADGGTGLALTSTDKTVSAAGSAPTYACRAWVTFAGATGTIVASGNVTSVTRGAAGNYTVNFTTAMPDANYSAMVTCSNSAATALAQACLGLTGPNGNSNNYSAANITTTSLKFVTANIGNAGVDPEVVHVAIFR